MMGFISMAKRIDSALNVREIFLFVVEFYSGTKHGVKRNYLVI